MGRTDHPTLAGPRGVHIVLSFFSLYRGYTDMSQRAMQREGIDRVVAVDTSQPRWMRGDPGGVGVGVGEGVAKGEGDEWWGNVRRLVREALVDFRPFEDNPKVVGRKK